MIRARDGRTADGCGAAECDYALEKCAATSDDELHPMQSRSQTRRCALPFEVQVAESG